MKAQNQMRVGVDETRLAAYINARLPSGASARCYSNGPFTYVFISWMPTKKKQFVQCFDAADVLSWRDEVKEFAINKLIKQFIDGPQEMAA